MLISLVAAVFQVNSQHNDLGYKDLFAIPSESIIEQRDAVDL